MKNKTLALAVVLVPIFIGGPLSYPGSALADVTLVCKTCVYLVVNGKEQPETCKVIPCSNANQSNGVIPLKALAGHICTYQDSKGITGKAVVNSAGVCAVPAIHRPSTYRAP
jgi:hypothetical protein